MRRGRGFLLKHRISTVFRRFFRRRSRPCSYGRIGGPTGWVDPLSRLARWTERIKSKAKAVLSGQGYIRVGQEPFLDAPKGQIAVYVGQKEDDFERILVPIVYVNHPLFGDLLKESEKEFGFNHPGGLTIPCRISDFERVHTRIKAGHRTSRKSHRSLFTSL